MTAESERVEREKKIKSNKLMVKSFHLNFVFFAFALVVNTYGKNTNRVEIFN